jgi:Tfp pilus assembly protein PilE
MGGYTAMQERGWYVRRAGRSGITLVQVIVCLVILGILVAVSVARYVDLVTLSRQKMIKGALATGMTVCSTAYARETVLAGARPAVANVRNRAASTVIRNDYNYTYTVAGETIQIAVSGRAGTPVSGVSTSGVWNMPPP